MSSNVLEGWFPSLILKSVEIRMYVHTPTHIHALAELLKELMNESKQKGL